MKHINTTQYLPNQKEGKKSHNFKNYISNDNSSMGCIDIIKMRIVLNDYHLKCTHYLKKNLDI